MASWQLLKATRYCTCQHNNILKHAIINAGTVTDLYTSPAASTACEGLDRLICTRPASAWYQFHGCGAVPDRVQRSEDHQQGQTSVSDLGVGICPLHLIRMFSAEGNNDPRDHCCQHHSMSWLRGQDMGWT